MFGLVEQNYELPEEVLNEMGIQTRSIPRTEIERIKVKTISLETDVSGTEYETINLTVLRRCVIGSTKVGYVSV